MSNLANERLFLLASAPFEAARRVLVLPEGHPSRRLHGHSFMARVRVKASEHLDRLCGTETKAFQSNLASCVSPLDYRDLNEVLDVPTDENVARWIRDRLDVPHVDTVGVQSTGHQGVELDKDEQAHVWRRFRFEAAHQLPNVEEGHPCGRMHGHSFEVILHARQDVAGSDLAVDYDWLATVWRPLHDKLNYACLNEIPGLQNPTSELLAHWIWQQLKPEFPELSWVKVYETATAGCHYDGLNYSIWKEQAFEAALHLPRAPDGDPRRGVHGHSYVLRLHLSAPLDEVFGWTIDYGDVKEQFKPYYEQLDHHTLNAVEGVGDTGGIGLARWLAESAAHALPQLDRVDVYESPECGVALQIRGSDPILPT